MNVLYRAENVVPTKDNIPIKRITTDCRSVIKRVYSLWPATVTGVVEIQVTSHVQQ
jgi:hypothetical protein